jgi:predicted AAA+ superfamily ATPase
MEKLIQRVQLKKLKQLLKEFPIVAVIGPRQVGKTTLVKDLLDDKKRSYFSFDDPAIVLTAKANPYNFLTQSSFITIDEVQKLPEILVSIKRIVDERRIPGQFLLTGSANITFLPKVSESLAGRVVFLELMPFTIFELTSNLKSTPNPVEIIKLENASSCWNYLNSLNPKKIDFKKIILNGGFPEVWFIKDDVLKQEWFKGYVRTYLERDVRDLSRIQRLYDYQKFLSLCAFRCSQILNRSELAKDSGIPYTTANHYLDLLLATFQIFLIQPYFKNIGKRLIKSPKIIWNDTGLALYLQGINNWQDAERLGRIGFLVENKIILELKTLISVYLPLAKLFYWRTSAGAEVDLVIEYNEKLIPIEIKWSEIVEYRAIAGMYSFMDDFKTRVPFGVVLYRGKNLLKFKENIFLVPYELFL